MLSPAAVVVALVCVILRTILLNFFITGSGGGSERLPTMSECVQEGGKKPVYDKK